MSDIGIVYFSGGLCLLIGSVLWGNCDIVLSMLGCLSLCSLPYILFSIGYQKWVIKKWCMLCIGIMCTLLAEIGWFIGYGFHIPSFSWHQTFIFLSIFTLCAFGWFFLYRTIQQFEQIKKDHLMYLSLKKNHRIFRNLWKEEDTCYYPDSYTYNPEDNRIRIDIALSLHCKHCAALFKQILLLTDKSSDIYSFQLHFTWSEENIHQHTFMHRLISIHQLQDERKFLTYLQRWYKEQNYDILNTKNTPQLIAKDDLMHHLSKNREWYRINHIMQTPTIYVGGKKLPDIYQLEDLRYLSDCFI